MILALALWVDSAGLALALPVNQTISYRESFIVAEKSENRDLRARATRVVTLRFGELKKGQSTVGFSYAEWTDDTEGATSEDAQQLATDLRSALSREPGTFQINERGQVTLAQFPEGTRPFFGLVLPPKKDSLPDTWGEKLIAPYGVEKPIDFKFKFEGLSSQDANPVFRISLRASNVDKTTKFNLSGDMFVTPEGNLIRSMIDSRWEAGGLVTSIAYRAERS